MMVLLETSQTKQITKRFFHQSGFFEFFQNTRYGMDRFFSFRFEITIYSRKQRQKNKTQINLFWRLTGTGKHPKMILTMSSMRRQVKCSIHELPF